MSRPDEPLAPEQRPLHLGSLGLALGLMSGGTLWPRALVRDTGRVDHLLALLLLWAMSAGFVHGLGFVPRHRVPRALLSGGACLAGLGLALAWRLWR